MIKRAAVLAAVAAGSLFFSSASAFAAGQDTTGSQNNRTSGSSNQQDSSDRNRNSSGSQTGSSQSGSDQTRSSGHSGHGGMMSSSGGALSSSDRRFVMEAAMGGMAEVELGRLATQNAGSDDVKQFGQRMVDDHSKANDQLKEVAGQKGIMLPAELDPKHRALRERLSRLNGAAFDRAYMSEMVKDHDKDVSMFERQSTKGQDADVKRFASETLPTLKEHQQMARDVASKIKSGGSQGRQNSHSSHSSSGSGQQSDRQSTTSPK